MFICQCAAVTDTAIAQAVQAGAKTLAQACRLTGAGRDCGACVFSVKKLLSASSQVRAMAGQHAALAATA
jgi:bacterioferritin-associated ferredoxin